ncbi:MAG: hypothetical protein ACM3YO_08760 [Bacteroidota bacterium]
MQNRVGIVFNGVDPDVAFRLAKTRLEAKVKVLQYGTTEPERELSMPLEIAVEIDGDWSDEEWDKFVNELREESKEARIDWRPLGEKWQGSQTQRREE